ncbi:prepilin peptidase [Amnibacterium sp. CER49]|uniref:prepilin peptidase n=1 Tax=Amnibacterium sp. CER49 TaxID=3039161 RepID=UPI00244B7A5E|nr:prepilin peptidase [Amnibacterium sp. CER49]MDH2443887.1 prepilin peptidase [Amnibacterium sp. CER49]
MSAVLLPTVALLGLLVGSFLNVVVHRVPLGLSVVAPASSCPGCGSRIAARDNVPLVSWALLRGACRTCRMPIPVRYPLVEALTAVAFVVAAAPFLPALERATDARTALAAGLELAAYCYLAAISVALAAIDLDVRRLPDRIVLPAYLVGAVFLGAADLLRGDAVAAVTAAAGAACSFAFYYALAWVKPGAMGYGDVKLAGVLGLFLGQVGVPALVVGTFAAFLGGGLFGVVILLSRRGAGSTAIPFGPWMLAGAWVGVLFGAPLATAYLALAGLA